LRARPHDHGFPRPPADPRPAWALTGNLAAQAPAFRPLTGVGPKSWQALVNTSRRWMFSGEHATPVFDHEDQVGVGGGIHMLATAVVAALGCRRPGVWS